MDISERDGHDKAPFRQHDLPVSGNGPQMDAQSAFAPDDDASFGLGARVCLAKNYIVNSVDVGEFSTLCNQEQVARWIFMPIW